ncbi:hypothetical protein LLE49_13225 [Alicyclobacillus tolerans]|uniref:hypothetical protein n=1 Tax=Alicyclobacillus tolerans TaxID=90970 RepID=UPI001F3008E7|nr:hypothetical protein [Alicyclobacillus tolerans]MCF8565680.1 hypothetical protein [Alicyclobacillus tolerans]
MSEKDLVSNQAAAPEPGLQPPRGLSRREHQEQLARQRRRRRKRRKARLRRLRMVRAVRSAQFWTRFLTGAVGVLALVFWAKFAYVFNIPPIASQGALSGVESYVTVKTWWFGPPAFDLAQYADPYPPGITPADSHPYQTMLDALGRYQSVVVHPNFVWVQRTTP